MDSLAKYDGHALLSSGENLAKKQCYLPWSDQSEYALAAA